MQPETYRMLANRQDRYWWHRARRQMAISLLRRYDIPVGGTWLDLGCGPGGNLGISKIFQPRLTLGVDVSPLALELAATRSHSAYLVRADLNGDLPLSSASCDVITVFNVLYHQWVHDEALVMSEVKRVLRPQGLLLLTEPAFRFLRREMDTAAMTRRRYRRSDLISLCTSAGLDVLFTSYFTSFGLPLLAALKAIQRFRRNQHHDNAPLNAPDMRPLNPSVNEILYGLAAAEGHAISRGLSMPCGTTILCLARNLA
jgi:SAM-dependent methyltransferase